MEKDLETQTEEIVQSMMYVSNQIDIKEKEISSLRSILSKYKKGLKKLHPEEDINVVEYLTKQKILRRERGINNE